VHDAILENLTVDLENPSFSRNRYDSRLPISSPKNRARTLVANDYCTFDKRTLRALSALEPVALREWGMAGVLGSLRAVLDELRAELSAGSLSAAELAAARAALNALILAASSARPRANDGSVMARVHESISLPYQGTSVTLAALPSDVLERMMGFLDDVEDLASLNATARLFRGAPSPRSLVERALCARMDARQHDHVATLVGDGRAHTLLELARVRQGAQRHACVIATTAADDECQLFMSAFVDASGGLHTCGEDVHDDDDTGEERSYVFHALGHGGDGASPPSLVPRRVFAHERVCITAIAMVGTTCSR